MSDHLESITDRLKWESTGFDRIIFDIFKTFA